MSTRMSLEAKLYFGTAGSVAATLANNVRDLTMPLDPGKSDISSRASRIAVYGPGMIEASLAWESNWSDNDAFVQALYAAAIAGTAVSLRTKDFATGKGWDADFIITKADTKQPLKEGQKIDFEATPTDIAGRAPSVYV
jgi:hypothetical protein